MRLVTSDYMRFSLCGAFTFALFSLLGAIAVMVFGATSSKVGDAFLAVFLLALGLALGGATLGARRFMQHSAVQLTPDEFRYWDGRNALLTVPWTAIEQMEEQGWTRIYLCYEGAGQTQRLSLPMTYWWDRGPYPNRGQFFFQAYSSERGLPSRIVAEIRTRAGLTEERGVGWMQERVIYSRPKGPSDCV